ncbi:hypothetical protein MYCTH_2071579 [Thermothelomyces thermophilus ATCC 42464]|uniref:Uncharacterized protein n=1 Tax=Thermothelomyces thermophilus (strain ATCC 42464 / BCRC 31852 / DSM 1799) TaxID=573729 RepID=G2QNA2_THET4|nr:uncharacterized protein MYCTH_2071579 [Thermothelomyces thermophilus ATCC 42464]AEO61975.1 hypothetical protein MYCTH_2071579 [Thermothelomyces thermophilus ATCC 42464]
MRTLPLPRPRTTGQTPSRLHLSAPPRLSRSYVSLQPVARTVPFPLAHHRHHHHHHYHHYHHHHNNNNNNRRPTPAPPSRTRTALSHHRSFSILPVIEFSVAASQTLLTTLHTATGTPWYLTIPLFAAAIGLVARLPTTVYTRRLAVRRERLAPLSAAWAARSRADLDARVARGEAPRDRDAWVAEAVRATARARRDMERRWGVQAWKNWAPALAVFPVWLAGIEGLRRMCGGPRGLLGSLVFGWKGVREGSGGVAGGEGVQGLGYGSGVVDPTALATAQDTATWYAADSSMITGGCLWFPDLTVADPYHILPFALSAILVINTLPKSQAGLRALFGLDKTPEAIAAYQEIKWRLRLQRGLLIVALAAGPLTMNLPAALHLYWVSSATMTLAQTAIISRAIPLPRQVPPAKGQDTFLMLPTRGNTR